MTIKKVQYSSLFCVTKFDSLANMPKKARKSLGRKYQGSRETNQPPRSQEDGPPSNEVDAENQQL